MIRLIAAHNYKCLKQIQQPLGSFHLLVGPNASGKTTFMDVFLFLSQLVSGGLERAIITRTDNFMDLVWRGASTWFELAVEFDIPENLRLQRRNVKAKDYQYVRYQVRIGLNESTKELSILREQVLLLSPAVEGGGKNPSRRKAKDSFPDTIFVKPLSSKTLVNKVPGGKDSFSHELDRKWNPYFMLGPFVSALGNAPEDRDLFPIVTWLKNVFRNGAEVFQLNSSVMRGPSRPDQATRFQSDGSNLPWVIESLKKNHPNLFRAWVKHLQTALPDLDGILIVEKEEDRSRYLKLCYRGGFKYPSWVVSDGTLRLLALTLLAYLPARGRPCFIEEPENGLHPYVVDVAYQSLSSIYEDQVLVATHSPVFVSNAKPEDILCFRAGGDQGTEIIPGNNHPALRNWKGEENLGVLYAGGVLG
jgi:predicted ATPase